MSESPINGDTLRALAKAEYERVLDAISIVERYLNGASAQQVSERRTEPDSPETKRCSRCEKYKRLDEFPRKLYARDDHANICKECAAAEAARRRELNRAERASEAAAVHWSGIKVCSGCKREKPVESFSPDGRTNDGFTLLCNDCIERERVVRKGESARGLATSRTAVLPTEKACTACGEIKPLAEFPANSVSNDGRRSDCKKCHNASRQRKQRQPDQNAGADHNARYCAKGRLCLAYPQLGQPAKLARYNDGRLCYRCEEAREKTAEDQIAQSPIVRPVGNSA